MQVLEEIKPIVICIVIYLIYRIYCYLHSYIELKKNKKTWIFFDDFYKRQYMNRKKIKCQINKQA